MSKYKNIVTGFARKAMDVFNLLPEELKVISDKRIGICHNCPMRKRKHCSSFRKGRAVKDLVYEGEQRFSGVEYNGCGCDLTAKTLVDDESCPLGKW